MFTVIKSDENNLVEVRGKLPLKVLVLDFDKCVRTLFIPGTNRTKMNKMRPNFKKNTKKTQSTWRKNEQKNQQNEQNFEKVTDKINTTQTN